MGTHTVCPPMRAAQDECTQHRIRQPAMFVGEADRREISSHAMRGQGPGRCNPDKLAG